MPVHYVDVKITEDDQVISALIGNAAAFQALGGVPLMLTEAVENSSDAIAEAREAYGMRDVGQIHVEIDPAERIVYVIDNGTGILQPVHVLEKPFKSLRRNADYAIGQFGRGIQGFRKFCTELSYVTRRGSASRDEEETVDKNDFSGRTVRLRLIHNERRGSIEVIDDDEFEIFANGPTGTVAIYQGWFPGEFERLQVDTLHSRLQHHFGELIRKGQVKISLRMGDDEVDVSPRTYPPDHAINMPEIEVAGRAGGTIGKIQLHLFYTSKADSHYYKHPFLMVDERPLGDSFIGEFPEFQDQPIWLSHYVTGFVSCDFVRPNDLRLALEPGVEKDLFVQNVRSAAKDLDRLIQDFQRRLFNRELEQEMNELAVQVQQFLRAEHIFDFTPLPNPGPLAMEPERGAIDTGPRTDQATNPDLGLVIPEGGISATIEEGGTGGSLPGPGSRSSGPGSGPGPIPDPSGLGGAGIGFGEVKVDEDPILRGHTPRRRRLRRPTGFGIALEPNELTDDMSWFEATSQTVVVNSEHLRYKTLFDKSIDAGTDSVPARRLRTYVIQRYLWEIVMYLGLIQKQMSREAMEGLFWDLNYKFFETRNP